MRSSFLFLGLLLACAEAPSGDLAPSADPLEGARRAPSSLVVSTPVPGDRLRLQVSAPAGAELVIVAGTDVGRTCPGAARACAQIARAGVIAHLTVPVGGPGRVDVDVPAALAVGAPLYFQALPVSGGVARSPRVDTLTSAPIALAGAWDDDFGGTRDISSYAWFDFGTFELLSFDNDAGTALARNASDTFFPGRYSRFDWTWVGDVPWYCQSAYDATTPAAALAAPSPDSTNPAVGGCGGFSWTRLLPAELALTGFWSDAFGGTYDIDSTTWVDAFGVWHITRFSNARSFVVAQNDAANPFFAGLWSRFDWAEVGADVYYCQTAYNAPTEAAAAYATPADATDPETGGCGGAWPGGFAWTKLSPP